MGNVESCVRKIKTSRSVDDSEASNSIKEIVSVDPAVSQTVSMPMAVPPSQNGPITNVDDQSSDDNPPKDLAVVLAAPKKDNELAKKIAQSKELAYNCAEVVCLRKINANLASKMCEQDIEIFQLKDRVITLNEMEKMQKENAELKAHIAVIQRDFKNSSQKMAALKLENDKLHQENPELKKQLEAVQNELQITSKKLLTLHLECERENQRLAKQIADFAITWGESLNKSSEKWILKSEYDQQIGRLGNIIGDLHRQITELEDDSTEKLSALQAEYDQKIAQLGGYIGRLRRQNKNKNN